MANVIPTMRSSHAIEKTEGLSYLAYFLKSKISVIRNIFPKYRTNQVAFLCDKMIFYALIATNKAKHILNRRLSCSCSDTIYSKRIKKKVPVSKVYHFSIKERKGAKIRNRYNQVPHLTQDTNGKVTNSQ